MKKRIINEQEVFAINEKLQIDIVTIGPNNSKIVIVDNFYKNPNLVRQLALDIPATVNKRLLKGLPGSRIDTSYQLDHFAEVYDSIIRKNYLSLKDQFETSNIKKIFESATFCCNVMQSKNLPPVNPHVDNRDKNRFASGIYLNLPDECAGGTAFYTFKGKQEAPPNGKITPNIYVTDSDGDWEMIYLAEMKFNRMIMYEQNILHSAYVKSGMFEEDTYRLIQMFFI